MMMTPPQQEKPDNTNRRKSDYFTKELVEEFERCRVRMTSMEKTIRTQGEILISHGSTLEHQNTVLDTLTVKIADINDDTSEMREIFRAGKGGLKVIGWLGNLAKWAGGIAVALTAIYTWWHLYKVGPPP